MKPKDQATQIKLLEKEEKRLFDTYNWRASADVKIKHLSELIGVITNLKAARGK
jgi:hypothetical protein